MPDERRCPEVCLPQQRAPDDAAAGGNPCRTTHTLTSPTRRTSTVLHRVRERVPPSASNNEVRDYQLQQLRGVSTAARKHCTHSPIVQYDSPALILAGKSACAVVTVSQQHPDTMCLSHTAHHATHVQVWRQTHEAHCQVAVADADCQILLCGARGKRDVYLDLRDVLMPRVHQPSVVLKAVRAILGAWLGHAQGSCNILATLRRALRTT